jgi:multiple sugar transport system ATP-binding protein
MGKLALRGIVKEHAKGQVTIHGVDLDVRDGEFLVFVGPSGCGKSTMLRMIAGLESITAGTLEIDDVLMNEMPPAGRGVAMVFQSYALYPHLSVAENLRFPLLFSGLPKDAIAQRVAEVANVLQLTPLLQRKPAALSGGQRQRVAIGRAIVREPKVFLFDEPLSNLDAALRVQMRIELSQLHRRLGTTMIYVTHDQVEAMTLGQRIVVFNAGRIEQVGTPLELYDRPANLFVAGFLGTPKMNLIPGSRTRDAGPQFKWKDGAMTLPEAIAAELDEEELVLGVRAQHLQLVDPGTKDGLVGQVSLVEHLGDMALAHVSVAGLDTPAVVKVDERAGVPVVGQRAGVRVEWERVHWFSSRDGRALHVREVQAA